MDVRSLVPSTGAHSPPSWPHREPLRVDPTQLTPYEVPKDLVTSGRVQQSAPQDQLPDPEKLRPVMDQVKQILEQFQYGLEYGLYHETGEFYATITDLRTQKVVREIPTEEVLELHRRLHQLVGSLIDEKA